MFQVSQLGKREGVKSKIACAQTFENVYVTPDNDRYKCVSINKVGRKYQYVYEWINAPKHIENNQYVSDSKNGAGCYEITMWIRGLKN